LTFFDLQIYNFFTMSVYNLQGFEAKTLSTNLQEFLNIIVDSKAILGHIYDLQNVCPPPGFYTL
jgi:hypothetical protein